MRTSSFGGTVNQAVVHPMDKLLSLTEGFGDAVNQVVMQKEQRKGQRSACF